MEAVFTVTLPVRKLYSGKVRELFEIDRDRILMVTTDRISAFDFILPTPVPGKGSVLNRLSLFWFEHLRDVCGNHVDTAVFDLYPEILRGFRPVLDGRSVIVKKTEKLPIECVVRGYLAGSGWREYGETGAVCGIPLPSGLRESEKLPEPLFTPSTKEDVGVHDRNMSFEETAKIIGSKDASFIRDKSIELYLKASARAEEKGIMIADTKFEFGRRNGAIIVIDEIFTPDSSRFWEREKYKVGQSQDSLDKQYVRDYLVSIRWNKQAPAPALPPEVVEKTGEKYAEIFRILTT